MLQEVVWNFPLSRTHTGMPLGNATTGLLVWGEKNHLKITIGRADLWDNRGGLHWSKKQNYFDIKKHLGASDEVGLRDIFKPDTEGVEGQPACPSIIPVGRIDLLLPEGSTLKTGVIQLKTAEATVNYVRNDIEYNIKINLAMETQQFCIEADNNECINIKSVPSWDFLGDYFASISIKPPVILDHTGWIQELPQNDGICVAYRQCKNIIYALTARDGNTEKMNSKALDGLSAFENNGIAPLKKSNATWWNNYWSDVPEIEIPNQKLDFCYSYGLYKFAGLTNPSGTVAGLQGPWIEEYDMPPWSSDYHFNINVQMCYWPAYKANRLGHLMPLFQMVWSWRDQLRKNAKVFVGIDDGYMLPHAVDDKCTCMGVFWTGTIDHACAAWIAQMMYKYVLYSGDQKFLREIAYPFMKGTMRVFEEMLEKDGDSYYLPVSVSPEYRGDAINAWGKNASFQLAAIHRLCEDLISASKLLGEPSASIWHDINGNLPQYTLIGKAGAERIALWEGTDLEESHRHHSHLGAICPFDTIDIFDKQNMPVVNRTVKNWINKGTGLWSGWCVPWASMLQSRMHNGTMAEIYLEILTKIYMNEGYGMLHDPVVSGFSDIGGSLPLAGSHNGEKNKNKEIMQMDAGMGAIVAVQDMLLHSRRDIIYIFPGVPSSWKHAKITNMPCQGGFFISAELKDSKILSINIKSKLGGNLKLGNPCFPQGMKIIIEDNESIIHGKIINITLAKETNCTMRPA